MRAFAASYRDVLSANKASTREKVFLGDFFAPAKKLPARKSGSFCFQTSKQKKELDSGFRRNDEHRQERKSKSWIPAFAGMTSKDESERSKAPDSGLTSSAVVKLFAGMTIG